MYSVHACMKKKSGPLAAGKHIYRIIIKSTTNIRLQNRAAGELPVPLSYDPD